MSGPALEKKHSHSSIHEAILNEARELAEYYKKSIDKREYDKALEIACVAVEHWETRTLAHAQSEEEGLYKTLSSKSSHLKESVISLTRDHDLMRRLVGEIKEILVNNGAAEDVHYRFQTLILIDAIHNHDEEEKLLKD